jgi:hypothetical protein
LQQLELAVVMRASFTNEAYQTSGVIQLSA